MKNNIPHEHRNSAGIYEILNTANGKRYIGCTTRLRVRFKNHLWAISAKGGHNILLKKDLGEYGLNAFEFNVLYVIDPTQLTAKDLKWNLYKKEIEFIKRYQTTNLEFGYNMTSPVLISWGCKQRIIRNGEKSPTSKLSLSTVTTIKILIAKGWSNMQIAEHLGIKSYMPTTIRNGYTWKQVEISQQQIDNYNVPPPNELIRHRNFKLTKAQVLEIKSLIEKGVRLRIIADEYGLHEESVLNIKRGVTWAKVN